MRNKIELLLTGMLAMSLVSCGDQNNSKLKEAWDFRNDPEIFGAQASLEGLSYSYSFEALPSQGELKNRPWSGGYWPSYKGGIAYRWNLPEKIEYTPDMSWEDIQAQKEEAELARVGYDFKSFEDLSDEDILYMSPAEKFDLFVGDDRYTLTNAERSRTRILKTLKSHDSYDPDFEIPRWEGLCHAWAPVVLNFDNPGPVELVGASGHKIPFGSADVQALLNIAVHYDRASPTDFLGVRCNTSFEELKEKRDAGLMTAEEFYERIEQADCKGTNAGSFHIILANELGLRQKSFVMDITRDLEVWNQPVEGFSSEIVERDLPVGKNAALGTVTEHLIRTTLRYTGEIQDSFEIYEPEYSTHSIVYEYRLEIDAQGNIVGGSWISEQRPDFLWRRELQDPYGYFAPVKEIYEAATQYKLEPDSSEADLIAEDTNTGSTDEGEVVAEEEIVEEDDETATAETINEVTRS